MGSPMPNTPMSGGQNPPMGGAPQQNSPMSGPTPPMGGPPQQNSPMSGNQQFGSSPTSTPPQNTFNPYMGGGSSPSSSMGGGGFSGNVNAQSSRFGPMAPLSGEEANRRNEFMNAKEQSMPQMGGMGPNPGSGIIGLLPRQSPYAQDPLFAKQAEFQNQMQAKSSEVMNSIPEYQQIQKMQQQLQGRQPNAQEAQQLQALSQQINNNSNYKQMQQQQQQMGQQFHQQYGSQLSALQDKERQYNLQQQQMIAEQRKMGGGQQRVDGRMPGPGDIGPRPTQVLYASPDRPATPGMSRDQMMDAAVSAGRLSGMGSAGPSPYQTASPLMPQNQPRQKTLSPLAQKAQMRAEQRQLPAGQRAISRGAQAATQPYTPVNQKGLTPGQSPLNPAAARMPGNFAMPMQGQNNSIGEQSVIDAANASNVSSAGRRRLV